MRITDIVAIRQAAPASVGQADPGWMPRIVLDMMKIGLGWVERFRQRRALDLLDERLLKDIGLDRHQAADEVNKPFWQA